MDVDFAFVCDYAELAAKINALGIGFDTIYARQVPVTHQLIHLVAQIRAHLTEAGEKQIAVRIIDADGKDIRDPLTGTFKILAPAVGTESIGRIDLVFQSLQFPRYGLYSIHVVIQGREMIRIPLRVAEPPATG